MRLIPLAVAAALLCAAAPHASARGDLGCYGTKLELRAQHPSLEVCPLPTQP
jgi:hypothetical protein